MSRTYGNESDEENEEEPYEIVYAGEESKRSYVSKDGNAKATFPNGDSYEGAYVSQMRNGRGEYIFAARTAPAGEREENEEYAKYSGEYKDGQRNGVGTFVYPDKSSYIGQWKCDERHGHGVYTYSSGDKYVGQWVNDEKNGEGTYIYCHDATQLSGHWKKGKLENGLWRFYEGGKEFLALIKKGKVQRYISSAEAKNLAELLTK